MDEQYFFGNANFQNISQNLIIDENDYIENYTLGGLNEISAAIFPGENIGRFKEIIDLNPDIDIFGNLDGKKLKIPPKNKILKFAEPVLEKGDKILSEALEIAQYLDKIPSLKGYSTKAILAIESYQSILNRKSKLLVDAKKNEEELKKVIPWLLSGEV